MKKILFVITKSNFGGAQRYVYDLATSLIGRYDIVVALGGDGILKEKLAAAHIRTISLPSLKRDVRLSDELRSFKDLYTIIKEERPSVLHLNSSKAAGIGALAGRMCGVPRIVFTAHAWAFNEERPWYEKKIIWFLSLLTILLSHVTICVSDAVRDSFSFAYIKKKMVTIHLGITESPILSRPEARAFFAAHAPITDNTTVVASIAELHPVKGLVYAIEAMKAMPQSVYCILGEGDHRSTLEAYIRTNKLEQRVFLLGYVPQANRYLSGADIFLLPSISEALGYVLLEAGLARTPVVATKVGGIPEVIHHNETGVLIPPRDSTAIQKAILGMSPEQSKIMTDHLYKKIVTDFSLERMSDATISEYEQAHKE